MPVFTVEVQYSGFTSYEIEAKTRGEAEVLALQKTYGEFDCDDAEVVYCYLIED